MEFVCLSRRDTAPDTGERKLHPLPGAEVRIGARLLRTRGLLGSYGSPGEVGNLNSPESEELD